MRFFDVGQQLACHLKKALLLFMQVVLHFFCQLARQGNTAGLE